MDRSGLHRDRRDRDPNADHLPDAIHAAVTAAAHEVIAGQLLVAGIPSATPTRPGWSIQDGHAGAVAAVFWGIASGYGHVGRPARIAGLGAVLDALTGRWNLTLHGRHWADGAPFCVLVYPHQPLRDAADATQYADPKAV